MNHCNLSYQNFEDNKIILDETSKRFNGRVNIAEPSPEAWFEMKERIAVSTKASDYTDALQGELESSTLSNTFFSAANMQIIQNGIRAGVYKLSNNEIMISPQNVDTLKIIMRSTFLQYSEHGTTDIPGQIQRLNDIVLDYAVKNVDSAAVSHLKYIEDQSTLAVPLELPSQPDRDYKHLERKRFV